MGLNGTLRPVEDRTFTLGPLDQIPVGEGRRFRAGGVSVAVYRTRQGKVFATQESCPHLGGPLADGLVGGDTLICPLHSFKFDLRTGKPLGSPCEALTTYAVSVSDDGNITVTL